MSTPLLETRNLTVTYPARGRRAAGRAALQDVSLVVESGHSVGVVGESGSGKSTLARAILALVPPAAGEVRWQGQPVRRGDPAGLRSLRRGLQIVFQDPFGSLDPRMTVGASVAEALEALEGVRDRATTSTRVAAAFDEVGLDARLAGRYPHELSGGQCQRVAIARATIVRPRLLICDEAVSALDVSVQAQIVNLLRDLSVRHRMALLFISHNLAVVRHLCERIVVLYQGRLVEEGPRDALYAGPRHPYTRALLAAVPQPEPGRAASRAGEPVVGPDVAADVEQGCAFRPRCAWAAPVCAAEVPALRAAGPGRRSACHRWEALEPPR